MGLQVSWPRQKILPMLFREPRTLHPCRLWSFGSRSLNWWVRIPDGSSAMRGVADVGVGFHWPGYHRYWLTRVLGLLFELCVQFYGSEPVKYTDTMKRKVQKTGRPVGRLEMVGTIVLQEVYKNQLKRYTTGRAFIWLMASSVILCTGHQE